MPPKQAPQASVKLQEIAFDRPLQEAITNWLSGLYVDATRNDPPKAMKVRAYEKFPEQAGGKPSYCFTITCSKKEVLDVVAQQLLTNYEIGSREEVGTPKTVYQPDPKSKFQITFTELLDFSAIVDAVERKMSSELGANVTFLGPQRFWEVGEGFEGLRSRAGSVHNASLRSDTSAGHMPVVSFEVLQRMFAARSETPPAGLPLPMGMAAGDASEASGNFLDDPDLESARFGVAAPAAFFQSGSAAAPHPADVAARGSINRGADAPVVTQQPGHERDPLIPRQAPADDAGESDEASSSCCC